MNASALNAVLAPATACSRHGHPQAASRTVLTALGLYAMAALLIGYFGVNAYTGNHGLRAQQDLDQQIAQLQRRTRRAQGRARDCGSAASRC